MCRFLPNFHCFFLLFTQFCNSGEDCPTDGVFGEWGNWESECTVECGGGTMSRSRLCFGPGVCLGENTETVDCNTCPCDSGYYICAEQATVLKMAHPGYA